MGSVLAHFCGVDVNISEPDGRCKTTQKFPTAATAEPRGGRGRRRGRDRRLIARFRGERLGRHGPYLGPPDRHRAAQGRSGIKRSPRAGRPPGKESIGQAFRKAVDRRKTDVWRQDTLQKSSQGLGQTPGAFAVPPSMSKPCGHASGQAVLPDLSRGFGSRGIGHARGDNDRIRLLPPVSRRRVSGCNCRWYSFSR
jgi:hypothetical protein